MSETELQNTGVCEVGGDNIIVGGNNNRQDITTTDEGKPLINIITRTSGRPDFFRICRDSIQKQTYRKVRHLVSVDDEATLAYVSPYSYRDTDVFKFNRPIRQGEGHLPYNLYINHMLKAVTDGWILILDDDDQLVDESVIKNVVDVILMNRKVNCIIWKTQLGQKSIVPGRSFGNRIKIGDISSCSTLFHHSLIRDSWWDNGRAADGRFFARLGASPSTNICWIPKVFTKITCMPGNGRRLDLPVASKVVAKRRSVR